jgi:hypothetical protein
VRGVRRGLILAADLRNVVTMASVRLHIVICATRAIGLEQ